MLRLVAPAGTRLRPAQVWRASLAALPANGRLPDPVTEVANRLGAKHALGAGSGRAALYVVFKALHALRPDRNVVAIPGYTCFSVPAAVVRAGLEVYPVEVDPLTLDFDREALGRMAGNRLLCIVATSLFGFMNDRAMLEGVARPAGAFVVDDAAQAFGSTLHGCPAGMLGDAGVFSMGRGKPLFGMGGGLVVTQSDEIADAVRNALQTCSEVSAAHSLRRWLELAAYFVMFHPNFYRMADALPFLQLGVTVYDPGFPVEKLGPVARKLLREMLAIIEDLNAGRRQKANAIREEIGETPQFSFVRPHEGCQPVFTRLPVLAADEALRDRAVTRLRGRGIGASPMYPSAICDIPGLKEHMASDAFHCPRAEQVAKRLFALPTHSFLRDKDIREIAAVLHSC
jgi:dTDP-4-amino-4,6-dideoxygalactose transaminase